MLSKTLKYFYGWNGIWSTIFWQFRRAVGRETLENFSRLIFYVRVRVRDRVRVLLSWDLLYHFWVRILTAQIDCLLLSYILPNTVAPPPSQIFLDCGPKSHKWKNVKGCLLQVVLAPTVGGMVWWWNIWGNNYWEMAENLTTIKNHVSVC